ncbi:MAG TPA: septal ring lytic transglycosylase RlpA family protein [Candidatus Paceibacterota bacterium]|nr:septal ring lytic transglycosylase RlpA family protein [Candidatus Paceibacterota bacterium]
MQFRSFLASVRSLRRREVFRRHRRLLPLLEAGGLLAFSLLFAGPLLVDDAAHRILNDTARRWGRAGGAFIGLDATVARASVFSLVRDIRHDLELYDHGRRVGRRSINVVQFITRGSLATVGDLVRTFGVPLTENQALTLDLCRPLDDLKPGERLVVQPDPYQYGIASWYGPGFHGRLAASGEVFNMYDMTAAHRTLPLQTLVRVVHQRTGRSVIVRINDRGPYVAGRTLDLSWRARENLGMEGLAAIYVEVLDDAPLALGCP